MNLMRSGLTAMVMSIVAATAGGAQSQSNIVATPGVYDPGNTGTVTANLQTVLVPKTVDRHRRSTYLFLQKNAPTATNSAAGADFSGVAGRTLTSLSYEYTPNSACGGGSPRFDVSTDSGATFHFVGGCANGTKTTNTQNGNIIVTFDVTNPAQTFPPILPTERVTAMDILVDEGTDQGVGFAYIQNIRVNGQVVLLNASSHNFVPNHRHTSQSSQ